MTTVVIVNPYEIKHFKYGVVVNPSKFILVGKNYIDWQKLFKKNGIILKKKIRIC